MTLKTHDGAYKSLVNEIVDRSDGVFLWVYLVVRSLRRGMTNLDTPVELQGRLRELPTELEAFFQQIFDAMEKIYHQQAARLYRICLVARCKVSALDLAWFAEQDPDFGLRDDLLAISPSQFPTLSQSTVTRVQARCQDLLEFAGANLQFLHRTVKDFLETKDMSLQLEARAGKTFNPHNFLCNSMLLQMRLKGRLPTPTAIHYDSFQRMLESFCEHALCLDGQNELNLHLLVELDRSVRVFHSETATDWGEYARSLLADLITKKGIWSYFRQRIGGGIYVISPIGSIVQMTPLETALQCTALQCMSSKHRIEEVRRLLNEGADPNKENQDGTSEWERYILTARNWNWSSIENSEAEVEIIRTLLLHGADPGVVGKEDDFLQLLKKLRGEDGRALEELRLSLLPGNIEQQQVVNYQQRTLPNRKRSLHEGPDPGPKQIECAARKRR